MSNLTSGRRSKEWSGGSRLQAPCTRLQAPAFRDRRNVAGERLRRRSQLRLERTERRGWRLPCREDRITKPQLRHRHSWRRPHTSVFVSTQTPASRALRAGAAPAQCLGAKHGGRSKQDGGRRDGGVTGSWWLVVVTLTGASSATWDLASPALSHNTRVTTSSNMMPGHDSLSLSEIITGTSHSHPVTP